MRENSNCPTTDLPDLSFAELPDLKFTELADLDIKALPELRQPGVCLFCGKRNGT